MGRSITGNHDVSSTDNFRRNLNTENFGTTDLSGSTYTFIYGDAQFFAIKGAPKN
jgi:hypothetical protein